MVQTNIMQDRLQELFPIHYRNGNILMINADCMEVMQNIKDKEAELSCVDPPYGIGITREEMGGRKTIEPCKTKIWDNEPPNQDYFNELFRVSKNQIIWGGNYFVLPPSRYFAVWDKGETMYGRDFAEAEYAWIRSGGTRIYKESPNQLDRIHPTQKPVALYKWLLSRYAKPGDKILDTHGGSGSSVVACIEMGFPIVWIEKDQDYYEAALDRIRRAWQNRPRLFEAVDKNPVQNKLDL